MGCLIQLLQEYIIPGGDTLLSNSIYRQREGKMEGEIAEERWSDSASSASFFFFIYLSVYLSIYLSI